MKLQQVLSVARKAIDEFHRIGDCNIGKYTIGKH